MLALAPASAQDAPALGAASAKTSRIVVVVADSEDDRIAMVREAVAFWKGVAADLGFGPPFHAPHLVWPPAGQRPFENYAHQLSQLAGRLHSSDPGPAPPPALLDVDAEVVVLLSAQNLMPFAWPYGDRGGHFVAVPLGEERDHVMRNVIAHELGHVLGLSHTREPGVLMCQPCDTSSSLSRGEPPFLPLTDRDRERLRLFLGGDRP